MRFVASFREDFVRGDEGGTVVNMGKGDGKGMEHSGAFKDLSLP